MIHMKVNICSVLSWWSMELLESRLSPLVLGRIQVTAQWMFRGQPLKTLEKQAPICRNHNSDRPKKNKCKSHSLNHAYMDLRGRRKSVTVSPLRRTKTQKVDKSMKKSMIKARGLQYEDWHEAHLLLGLLSQGAPFRRQQTVTLWGQNHWCPLVIH